jgi:hypothetical protein
VIVFAATIGLSAFLLFLVQPIIAKQILPWFGGSAAVWTTCMVFFQVVLLAGYTYSDAVVRWLKPRQQALLHGVLLLASLALLPITVNEVFKPSDASAPIGRILLLLLATIGLPYFMLSTTGPLMQAWFARRYAGTPTAASVWRLYALSNVASMGALLAYPPLIEPNASTAAQSLAWSVGYGAFVLLAAASAVVMWKHIGANPASTLDSQPGDEAATDSPAPTVRDQALWLTLAATGSVLLLSITTHVTQNVASVPFMWLLPLALYLLSFILTFDGRGWYWQRWYRAVAALVAILMMAGLTFKPNLAWRWDDGLEKLFERGLLPLDMALPLYAFGLFVACMFLHGELVQRKPPAAYLTRFYLMVSLGGALGGLFVGVAAPLLMNYYWELPVALMLLPLLVALLSHTQVKGLGLMAAFLCGVLAGKHVERVFDGAIHVSRSFYGTLRVLATHTPDHPQAKRRLLHGVILHGEQYLGPEVRRAATTYYGVSSGVGQALLGLREMNPGQPQRVGLVGLGVGTLAAYGQPGDVYRFYELSPEVLAVAQSKFTYLADSRAQVSTGLGDARLVLEREAPQNFDVLAVDAFSSDSIPVHLLTREAMAVYKRHLRQGGVVAIHISNRYLELTPVVQQLAQHAGMTAWRVVDQPPETSVLIRSDWVLVTANAGLMHWLKEKEKGQAVDGPVNIRPWTDDYNNLFDVLR